MRVKLPELGEGVHEGEMIKWHVKVGDVVKDDQPICEIMTDKATVEFPSPFHGKVTEILIKEGEVVKVGQDILGYENAGAATGASKGAAAPAPAAKAPAAQNSTAMQAQAPKSAPAQTTAPQAASSGGMVAAAPSTRKFAREAGIDISQIAGSGPGGRVMREDLERAPRGGNGSGATAAGKASPAFARAPARPAGGEERVPFRGLRKKIAEKMRLSKDKAAHFTYVEECDASELVKVREQAKEIGAQQGIKVTYLPFIMKAMVAALKHHPTVNSELDEAKGEQIIKHYYNIAISVQTDDGLTAPVIKDVAGKSILQLAKEIQDVVDRARHKKLTMEDLTGGTITLTNAGSIGGLFATPVINYPEVAIVGFNKIFRKPIAKKINGREEIVVADWTYFSISLDHRVIDGAVGAEYMKTMIRYVENPSLLLLESL